MLRVLHASSDLHSRQTYVWKSTHPSAVGGFFHLRQLRRLRRSLNSEAASTLIQSFVFIGVDYCNCLMAGAPKKWTEKLQRGMNAAARILTQTKKYDGGADSDTSWWAALAWRSWAHPVQALRLHVQMPAWHSTKIHDGSMPTCICNLGTQSLAFSGERAAWCTTSNRLSTHGKMAFSYAGTSAWNSLPNYLKDSSLTLVMFKRSLRTFFQSISTPSALEMCSR